MSGLHPQTGVAASTTTSIKGWRPAAQPPCPHRSPSCGCRPGCSSSRRPGTPSHSPARTCPREARSLNSCRERGRRKGAERSERGRGAMFVERFSGDPVSRIEPVNH
eukprot:431977-Rhodomonas_salina.1